MHIFLHCGLFLDSREGGSAPSGGPSGPPTPPPGPSTLAGPRLAEVCIYILELGFRLYVLRKHALRDLRHTRIALREPPTFCFTGR